MRSKPLFAAVRHSDREVFAEFYGRTGRLVVSEGRAVIEEFSAPDSWLALAAVNGDISWGTRPRSEDLLAFLERHRRGFKRRLSVSMGGTLTAR